MSGLPWNLASPRGLSRGVASVHGRPGGLKRESRKDEPSRGPKLVASDLKNAITDSNNSRYQLSPSRRPGQIHRRFT